MSSILLFTSLYPDSDSVSRIEQTFAVHNLVKYWKDDDLLVIKPVRVRVKSILRIFAVKKSLLDGVSIVSIPFFQIPLCDHPFFPPLFFILGIVFRKKKFKPDIVVSHYDISHILGAAIKKKLNIPHIAVVHNSDLNRIKEKNHTANNVFSSIVNADGIGFRSSQIQRRFVDFIGPNVTISRSAVIASGVSESEIIKPFNRNKKNEKNCYRIITVASLKKRKNIDKIIGSLAALRNYPWAFTVIGSGSEYETLVALSESYGLSNRITFTGLLEHAEVMSHLESSDIFILPSENETFGLVYLEAMAKGCMVIALRHDGIDGVITNDVNGFLCRTSAQKDVSITLETVFKLGELKRMRMLEASHITVNEYTEIKRSRIYHSFILDVLASNRVSQ